VKNTKIRTTRLGWLWICLCTALVSLACSSSSDSSDSSGDSVETITDNGIDLTEGVWNNGFGTELFFDSDGTWEHLDVPDPPDPQLVLTRGDFELNGDVVTLSGTVVDEIDMAFPAGADVACTGTIALLIGAVADARLQVVCTTLHIDTLAQDNTLDRTLPE
jgi:hypothetical protein